MKTLLILVLLCATGFADTLQDAYALSLKNEPKETYEVLNYFIFIFAAFGVGFLYSIIRFKRESLAPKKKIALAPLQKMPKNNGISKMKEIDFCEATDGYLEVLHKKSAKHNNKIFFYFNQKHPRFLVMNHAQICPLFFTLCEFTNDMLNDANITIGLRKKDQNNDKITYEFFVKSNRILADIEVGNIEKTLEKKGKYLEFKKLEMIANTAKLLGTDVSFTKWQRHCFFSFSYQFEIAEKQKSHDKNEKFNDFSRFAGKNTIILDSSKDAFFNLATKLKQLGANVQQKFDINLAKEHLFSVIYTPSYVFISTKVLRQMTANEIKRLNESKNTHNFKLILLSDNENYDEVRGDVKDYFLLYRPFNLDALIAALDAEVSNISFVL